MPDSSSQGTGLCEKKAPCGLHFWFGGRWLTESNLPDECAKRAMRPVEYALGCPQGSQPGVRDRAKKKPPPKIASPAPLDAMLFYGARGLPRHDAIAVFVCNATFAQQLCIRGGGSGGLLFRTTRSQHFSFFCMFLGRAAWLSKVYGCSSRLTCIILLCAGWLAQAFFAWTAPSVRLFLAAPFARWPRTLATSSSTW